jgi:alcohol dehydrogenase class IV
MLPAVCKWNAAQKANNDRQAFCVKLLLSDTLVHQLVSTKFGDVGKADLGDILDVIFRELGMPRTLKDVNVGRDQMENLAENSMSDRWIRTNAKRIDRKEEVMEILEMVVD